jgi:FAD/FMN-containing dehydrogenase
MANRAVEIPEEVRAGFSGRFVTLGDDGYDGLRRVHNGLIDKHPALIARCVSTADVVDAVAIGRRSGMEVAVRGGGHNVAGKATTDGVLIDLSLMKGIRVDPRRRVVDVGPGVTWREFDRATHVYGLATTGGTVSSTGVAGLALGGGLGYLMSRHGIVADNLIEAEVVTAGGDVVAAGEELDADLLWGLRGGGGNLGIATSLTFPAWWPIRSPRPPTRSTRFGPRPVPRRHPTISAPCAGSCTRRTARA